jgi:hypothetical protein
LQVATKILEAIGEQLRKLAISIGDTLPLDSVLGLCPRLRVLYISDFPLHFFDVVAPPQLATLMELREFGFFVEKYDERKHVFKTRHLLRVLRAAPNLRVLRAPSVFFDGAADADVSEALRLRTVLQKLKHLHFLTEWSLGPVVVADLFEKYSVLRAALRHCPKLVSVVT